MHIALVLHAHLPYVRHLEHSQSFEEEWLFEATWESYLRLIGAIEAIDPAHGPRITLSLSPTLLDMFADGRLRERFLQYLGRLTRLCERLGAALPHAAHAALAHHQAKLQASLARFHKLGGDVTRGFVDLRERGLVELITTAATHAFLPSLKTTAAIRAQLRLGLKVFEHHTKRTPSGLWLPECGFEARLDQELSAAGVGYTILDTHGVSFATPRPPYDVYAPVMSESGVAYFGREPAASAAVWSRSTGYPKHAQYREFHRDVGLEVDPAVLEGWVFPSGERRMTGVKLWAIGGGYYDPEAAASRARIDARAFVDGAAERLAAVAAQGVEEPVVVAPFDAELFGHWWHEGPTFIEEVLRLTSRETGVSATNLAGHLDRAPDVAITQPAASSWGEGGFGATWVGRSTAGLWRHVHRAEVRALEVDAVVRDTLASEKRRRARLQTIRELLLLQASDWPFMIHTDHARAYAESRLALHRSRLDRLASLALTESWSPEDLTFLDQVEAHTPLFAGLEEDAYANAFDPW